MYLLFDGDTYYPAGGAYDLRGVYATLDEALATAEAHDTDWWHVYSLAERAIVVSSTEPAYGQPGYFGRRGVRPALPDVAPPQG